MIVIHVKFQHKICSSDIHLLRVLMAEEHAVILTHLVFKSTTVYIWGSNASHSVFIYDMDGCEGQTHINDCIIKRCSYSPLIWLHSLWRVKLDDLNWTKSTLSRFKKDLRINSVSDSSNHPHWFEILICLNTSKTLQTYEKVTSERYTFSQKPGIMFRSKSRWI